MVSLGKYLQMLSKDTMVLGRNVPVLDTMVLGRNVSVLDGTQSYSVFFLKHMFNCSVLPLTA